MQSDASWCCWAECSRCHFLVVPESEFRPQFQSRYMRMRDERANTAELRRSHYIFYLANWAAGSGGANNMIHYFALGSHNAWLNARARAYIQTAVCYVIIIQ